MVGDLTGITCFYDGRTEPRQIDFMLLSRSLPRLTYDCFPQDCSATKSDHRVLALRVYGGELVLCQGDTARLTVPKPIGWTQVDASYAKQLATAFDWGEARIGINDDFPPSEAALGLFSDGSFTKGRRGHRSHSQDLCGWGFAVFYQFPTSQGYEAFVQRMRWGHS
eukprot:5573236-Karenia_brevis.AAC.2